MPTPLPNCRDCLHYYITHDVSLPYGCRAMDFKSRRMPALDVLEVSGEPCHIFRPKPRPRPG
ncbi:MAG: hypothetical protein WBH99_02835 [Azovibrio sp.]|uniref:hypothetical protein n=1 Tax=Azovibrio sp. TaxID=1872673 RepID=UPI003C76707A